jgi:hypothetical protein
MSGLRPIGSEKLEGMDKIRRIMEIARYNENTPESINESKSTEYSLDLADGNTYEIVKERQGYIVKRAINESENDYIDPMQNRKYYPSYSQALKRLNLMAREFNALHENVEGTSLFNEQKKKYILKVPKGKPAAEETPAPVAAPPVPAPEPAPAPAPAPEEAMPPMGDEGMPPMGDEGMPPMGDEGMPPMSPGEDEGMPPPTGEDEGMPPMGDEEENIDVDVDVEPKEKKVSDLKRIQILVGKLSQKIRSYEESKELSAKDVKYIINSILSAIDVDVLSEKDIEQIIAKLDGSEDEEEEDVDVDVDVEDEEMAPEDSSTEEIEAPEGEMAEGFGNLGDAFNNYMGAAYANTAMRKMEGQEIEEEEDYGDYDDDDEYHRERRKGRKHLVNPGHFTHGTYTESSIDKVLSKYFTISESEEKENQIKQQERTQRQYKDTKSQVIRLSESIDQIEAATEYIKEYPRAKLFGISNKGNLIFKQGISEVKITKFGDIL